MALRIIVFIIALSSGCLAQDIQMQQSFRVPAPSAAPNLVVNGDFSSSTTGWTSVNSATLSCVSGGYSGNCLQVTNTVAAWGRARQTVTLSVGATYTLTGRCKNGTNQGEIIVYDNVSGIVYDTDYLNNASWTLVSFTFVATTATSYIDLVCRSTTIGNYNYYDDLTLTQN